MCHHILQVCVGPPYRYVPPHPTGMCHHTLQVCVIPPYWYVSPHPTYWYVTTPYWYLSPHPTGSFRHILHESKVAAELSRRFAPATPCPRRNNNSIVDDTEIYPVRYKTTSVVDYCSRVLLLYCTQKYSTADR